MSTMLPCGCTRYDDLWGFYCWTGRILLNDLLTIEDALRAIGRGEEPWLLPAQPPTPALAASVRQALREHLVDGDASVRLLDLSGAA